MADDTDLYLFVSGLGDQAACEQLGASFLKYVDVVGDPKLGRIVISVGSGASAFLPYKGDFNLHWVLGFSSVVDWLPIYRRKVQVQPDLYLTPSNIIGDQVNDANLESFYFPMGCGDVFHPLFRNREGLGYTGLDTKPAVQRDSILGPVLDRDDFEWRGRDLSKENWNPLDATWVSLEELNEWYNSKQAVFAMFFPESLKLGLVTGRVIETIASATPLICYTNPAIDEMIGYYPYQSDSREETIRLIHYVYDNHAAVREYFAELSVKMYTEHSYFHRVTALVERLKEMK
jgi:hypothetical protein